MKCLITGLNGTVAPFLSRQLINLGHEICPWDRSVVPTDDLEAIQHFLSTEKPEAFCHLATGDPQWAETIARLCAKAGVRFLFTSSVSVYSASQEGPFQVEDDPQPVDDYGRYKLDCEVRVRRACPDARIVRLGWQIGTDLEGNQMAAHLHRTFLDEGKISASVNWFQACSFLPDTALGLAQVLTEQPAGLYHLDSNSGMNFHEVATGLNRFLDEPWSIEPSDLPAQNNLLKDSRLNLPTLDAWFRT